MPKKTIEVSDTKAYQVQAIKYKGESLVSVRRLYRKKGDKGWSPAKQGVTFAPEEAERVAKFIVKYSKLDEDEFTEVSED